MGVGGQRYAPGTLLSGKRPCTYCTDAWWAPGLIWTDVEKLALTGIQSTECATPNDLPSRLRYPGPKLILNLLDTVFVT